MLNQDEFNRGLAEGFLKEAGLWDTLVSNPVNSLMESIKSYRNSPNTLASGLQDVRGKLGRQTGQMAQDALVQHANSPAAGTSVQPGFVGGVTSGLSNGLLPRMAQTPVGRNSMNDFLQSNGGGMAKIDDHGQIQPQWGNVIKHYSGMAGDWIKKNPGTAMLGGAGLLGGGLLLHNALSGGGNDEAQHTTPQTQPTPVGQSPHRFAFDKPGISG